MPLNYVPGSQPPVPVPYPTAGQHVPAGASTKHLIAMDGQRTAGLSPEGARQNAAGKPLTALGDQTRVIHFKPGILNPGSQLPMRMGDEAGVAGGTVAGGIHPSGLSPSQFKLMIPR